MRRWMLAGVVGLGLGAILPARAEEVPGSLVPGGGDPRVRSALDEAGLRYVLDADEDFQLLFQLGEGRSQVVFINSTTEKVAPFEVREVWTGAYLAKTALPKKVANLLLLDSFNQKVGAWALWPDRSGKVMAVFTVKIDADTPPEALASAVQAVMVVGDAMERRLSEKDVY